MSALPRIRKELREMKRSPPDGASAQPAGDNQFVWQATIDGPDDTPYEDGVFFLDIKFPVDYPTHPPTIKFVTKIYHCNINEKGEMCLDMVKDKWKPSYTIKQVLTAIRTLLEAPNVDSPLVGTIARQYKENKEAHDKVAAQWTEKYAQ